MEANLSEDVVGNAAVVDVLGHIHLLDGDFLAEQEGGVDAAVGTGGELLEVGEHAALEEAVAEELEHAEGGGDVALSAATEGA